MSVSQSVVDPDKSAVGSTAVTTLLLITWLFSTMFLWIFAFYDHPSEIPEWVRRAQLACFGSDESGLPNASGWMLLILSPALFLAAILMGLGDEVALIRSKLGISRRWQLVAVTLSALIGFEAVWIATNITNRVSISAELRGAVQGTSLPRDYPRMREAAPDFVLLDQYGNRRSLSSLRGRPVILSFVFAHCRSVCPSLVKSVTESSKSQNGEVNVLFVTLDPWRDTPASLPGLAKRWNLSPREWILSGTIDEVSSVLDAYKVPCERDRANGDVVHPSLVYIISAEGELAYSFNGAPTPWLEQALARLEG